LNVNSEENRMDGLKGRTAFVTGAASGIGLAVASALIEAGARVVLTDIDADLLARVVPPLGAHAAAFALDVTNRQQWVEARTFTEGRFGPVEILMCNAGIPPSGDELADMDPAVFDRIVGINLTGVFNGVATFAAGMRQRRDGHIVATASAGGLFPLPRYGAYSATKFAVVGMSESLRMEMAPHNVGVSVLCPGVVRTGMLVGGRIPASESDLPTDVGLNIIEPAEVAAMVLDGIRRNRSHILTHGETREQVEARHAAILAEFDGVPDRRAQS
jgi:NAD(P)-dependent dehydrogenase (short-subunit alcohol dehydrogenase family)